jgi:prevent-host-death family protein
MVEARKRLASLSHELASRSGAGAIKITRHGKPVLAVMSWDLYESVAETLAIVSDPSIMAAVHEGASDMKAGRTVPWEQARKELGL